MTRWSIHQDADSGNYEVCLNPDQVDLDEMPGNLVGATHEDVVARAEAQKGSIVGKPLDTFLEAVQKQEKLEDKDRQEARVTAAKELLGV